MSKTLSSASVQTGNGPRSKLDEWTIKNTFAENCENEYFTPAELFCLRRYGFPFDDLPEEGKQMVLEYEKEYSKKRTNLTKLAKTLQEMRDDPNIII